MTTRYVALLRGVNVGGRGKVRMDDLREAFRALGYTDVSTYIQSGNVVFTSDTKVAVAGLKRALAEEHGTSLTVALRSAAQMQGVVRRNPFPGEDTSKVHVGFMPRRPAAARARSLDRARLAPEDAVIDGSDAYLHLPNGIGRSKLPGYLERHLDVPITFRNWNTVTKLIELSRAG